MELYANLRIIRKHFLLVLLTTFMATVSALVIDRRHHTRTIWVGTAALALNPNVTNRAIVAGGASLGNQGGMSSGASALQIDLQTLVSTYDRYLKGIAFARVVVQRYHLPMSPEDLRSSIDSQQIPGTLYYNVSVSNVDKTLADIAAQDVAQAFVAADQQQSASQLQSLTQRANAVAMAASTNPQVVAASVQFWNERIAYVQKLLLGVYADRALTPDQRYQKVLSLESQLVDAQTNASKTLQPVQNALASAQAQAALYNGPAGPPTPISRSVLVKNLVLFAALGGFIVGLALALLREYLDSSLRNAEEVAEVLKLPVLATVRYFLSGGDGLGRLPLVGGFLSRLQLRGRRLLPGGHNAERALVTLTRPFDPGSEAFRNLRTGIQFADAVGKLRTIVVTSPLPNEGKSTVVANLAIVLARAGRRVILVDADMRRPQQHLLFGTPSTSGLSMLYIEEGEADLHAALDGAVQPTSVENLYLLPAGPIAPNPAELLASPTTPLLLKALAERADVVIIDTPAMALLTDGVILASQADGTIVVVRAHATRRDMVTSALAKLTAVNARILGIVLNMAHEPGGQRYAGYYGRRGGPHQPKKQPKKSESKGAPPPHKPRSGDETAALTHGGSADVETIRPAAPYRRAD